MDAMDVSTEARKKTNYKYCFVPLCESTTISTPQKHFISVPKNALRRKAWIKAVRRDERSQKLAGTSSLFCCEDHFNMEEDMENFLRFQMMGGYLRLKSHVVPHIFHCQPGRSAASTSVPARAAAVKRNSARIVSEVLDLFSNTAVVEDNLPCPEVHEPSIDLNQCPASKRLDLHSYDEFELTLPSTQPIETTSTRDVGIQARVSYRSKSTMCTPMLLGSVSSIETSPIKISRPTYCDAKISPIKCLQPKHSRLLVEDIFTDSSSEDTDHGLPLYTPTTCEQRHATVSMPPDSSDDSEDSLANEFQTERIKNVSLERTRFLSKKYSMMYLGLPNDSFYIVNLLAKIIQYRGKWLDGEDIVMLVLRKIRLNESFQLIANEFGISKSHANRLFSKYVSKIAEYVLELVVWPSKESILRQLPISFQARYSSVQSIIDCFEIEIEKPTNAVNQSLTWSDYKKCNTLKYLVSATPDGIINFISEGFGGRVSDMILLENSGYLDKLTAGMDVMADRGFKHVDKAIQDKQCKLVRPPSVSDGTKLSAADCKETKRIASLRIHIERVIRRIREFQLLAPHACVDVHILGKIDSCVYIAAGLINLQPPLIR